MARRILLGWELGENHGHILRLRDMAVQLRAEGHVVIWAVQRLDLLEGVALPGEPVFQAPLWPGQHVETIAGRRHRPARSYAETLAALGLDRRGAFGHLVRGWDAILAAAQPDAVFADFAPALLAAARGRVPTVTAGIGFVLPPAHLACFPRFDRIDTPADDAADEAWLVEEVNRGLAATGRAPIAALPALFDADAVLIAAFRELDPYHAHRRENGIAPFLSSWTPPREGPRDRVVVYFSENLPGVDALFAALDALRLPVTLIAPRGARHSFGGHVEVTNRLLSFDQIAATARLVLSNGNTGFVSAALLAGLPQVALPHDLQKAFVGAALRRLGTGISDPIEAVDWAAFPAGIARLYADDAVQHRARRLAGRLIPRMHTDPATQCAAALTRLAA